MRQFTNTSQADRPSQRSTTRPSYDFIALLDALYDLERPRELWFRSVLFAAGCAFDRGRGVGMLLYDVSGQEPRVEVVEGFNVVPENLQLAAAVHGHAGWADAIAECYRTTACATLDEHIPQAPIRAALRELYLPFGIADQVLINGANLSGQGSALYIFSDAAIRLQTAERQLLTRLASHLSTAYRLQRRLAQSASERAEPVAAAVLSTRGRIEHAEVTASSAESRRVLIEAVKAREWAHSCAAQTELERATNAWTPLVQGRWTLIDRLDSGGRRYITAYENAPAAITLHVLSPRELQIVSLAERGCSNKVIAYELGLGHSTVRVLLARAASKLAVRTRAQVIAKFRRLQQLASSEPAITDEISG